MLHVDVFVNLFKEARFLKSTRLEWTLTYASSLASLTFLNLFPECEIAKTRLIPEPILPRVTLVVPRPN